MSLGRLGEVSRLTFLPCLRLWKVSHSLLSTNASCMAEASSRLGRFAMIPPASSCGQGRALTSRVAEAHGMLYTICQSHCGAS